MIPIVTLSSRLEWRSRLALKISRRSDQRYNFPLVALAMLLLMAVTGSAFAYDSHYIVVAKDGSGQFPTITQALNSLPMFNYERVVIYIGERDYYYDCHRKGGDYPWFANNLSSAAGSPSPGTITPAWTFDDKWNPEATIGPKIVKYEIRGNHVLLFFKEPITVLGAPVLVSRNGKKFTYASGAGSDTLRFDSSENISKADLAGLSLKDGGKLLGTTATVQRLNVNLDLGI